MTLLGLADALLLLALGVVLVTQVVLPLGSGERMFPVFRRKGDKRRREDD